MNTYSKEYQAQINTSLSTVVNISFQRMPDLDLIPHQFSLFYCINIGELHACVYLKTFIWGNTFFPVISCASDTGIKSCNSIVTYRKRVFDLVDESIHELQFTHDVQVETGETPDLLDAFCYIFLQRRATI